MANITIPQLPSATSISGSEQLEAVQSSTSVRLTTNQIAQYTASLYPATAFTYQTYSGIPSAALLTGTTNMVTALVGLPYGYTTIPQIGP